MTFAAIFMHSNYPKFLEWIDKKSRKDYALVSCRNGDIPVPKNAFEDEKYDWNITINQMVKADRPILLAAGPLACVLSYEYWRRGPRKYPVLDIGSALDEAIIHYKCTRMYQKPNAPTNASVCVWKTPSRILRSQQPEMESVGIVVAAVDIPDETIKRFQNFIPMEVKLAIVRDFHGTVLSRTRLLNKGIQQLRPYCRIIICTDIDMIVPPGLLEYTARVVRPGTALWSACRKFNLDDLVDIYNIQNEQWKNWTDLPCSKTGKGSWVAMDRKDWNRIGGWDERLFGWGGEDDALQLRRKGMKIKTIESIQYPLMHVNHEQRNRWGEFRGKANLQLAKKKANVKDKHIIEECGINEGRLPRRINR